MRVQKNMKKNYGTIEISRENLKVLCFCRSQLVTAGQHQSQEDKHTGYLYHSTPNKTSTTLTSRLHNKESPKPFFSNMLYPQILAGVGQPCSPRPKPQQNHGKIKKKNKKSRDSSTKHWENLQKIKKKKRKSKFSSKSWPAQSPDPDALEIFGFFVFFLFSEGFLRVSLRNLPIFCFFLVFSWVFPTF